MSDEWETGKRLTVEDVDRMLESLYQYSPPVYVCMYGKDTEAGQMERRRVRFHLGPQVIFIGRGGVERDEEAGE